MFVLHFTQIIKPILNEHEQKYCFIYLFLYYFIFASIFVYWVHMFINECLDNFITGIHKVYNYEITNPTFKVLMPPYLNTEKADIARYWI
jgi:hypothetical protein